jgi:hypothetical protein
MYNRELRSTGLELTQFTLLMALNLAGEITQGNLGKLLALDSTSLTRDLRKNHGGLKPEPPLASDLASAKASQGLRAVKKVFRKTGPNHARSEMHHENMKKRESLRARGLTTRY